MTATMTRQQFIDDFIANAEWDTSQHWVQNAKLSMYSDSTICQSDNTVRSLSCISEVNLVLKRGDISFCYVYGLEIDVCEGQIECLDEFRFQDIFEGVFLNNDIITGFSASLESENEHTQAMLFDLFGNNANNSYAKGAIDPSCQELQLRYAVNEQMNKLINQNIKKDIIDTPFMVKLSEVAKRSIEDSVSALQSLIKIWPKTEPSIVPPKVRRTLLATLTA